MMFKDLVLNVDGVFTGETLMTTVGKVLTDFRNDSSYLIDFSDEYDFTAEDVLKYVLPLMIDEKCSFDVFYNESKTAAVLSIY